jgi:DNA-binding NtrC family response regulator
MLERDGDDLRVLATTHRALAGLVERGAFDQGLYERLAGAVIEVPPLRQRPEDIIPLAERFGEEAGAKRPVRMSPGALARVRSYPWPGNVLELRNAMERAVRLAGSGEILAEHLPSDVPIGTGEGRLREHVDSVERDAIVKALADANHNQTHAARRLGISRRALIYKMEKYGLKPPPGASRRA